MTDHRALAGVHAAEAHAPFSSPADRQIDATLAVHYATLALVDATNAQTAAMERIARDQQKRTVGL